MRRAITILFAAVFITGILTGCAGNSTKNNSDSNNQGKSEIASKYYADIMKSGKYLMHYKTKMTVENNIVESEVTMATDGTSTSMITNAGGMYNHIIVKGDTLYMLNDSAKTYIIMSIAGTGTGGTESNVKSEKINTSGILYTGKGKGELNGKTLDYEEYKTDEGTIRYYFENNKLYAIVFKAADSKSEVVMEIIELTDKVTAEMFEIPSGYTQAAAY
ncbi:MAG: hypothetical protein AB9844_09990 [Clostridiaceae bacterium]